MRPEGWIYETSASKCRDLPDKNYRRVRGWSIQTDLFTSGDLLDFSHAFLSYAPVMTARLQIFADTNQN